MRIPCTTAITMAVPAGDAFDGRDLHDLNDLDAGPHAGVVSVRIRADPTAPGPGSVLWTRCHAPRPRLRAIRRRRTARV